MFLGRSRTSQWTNPWIPVFGVLKIQLCSNPTSFCQFDCLKYWSQSLLSGVTSGYIFFVTRWTRWSFDCRFKSFYARLHVWKISWYFHQHETEPVGVSSGSKTFVSHHPWYCAVHKGLLLVNWFDAFSSSQCSFCILAASWIIQELGHTRSVFKAVSQTIRVGYFWTKIPKCDFTVPSALFSTSFCMSTCLVIFKFVL